MSLTKATYSMINGAPVNVLDFGAIGDGVTDNTAAMQAAHDTGHPVYYPIGSYLFTSITIPAGGIIGELRERTYLLSNATGANSAITVTSTLPTRFSDFQFGSGSISGAAAFKVDPGATFENNKLLISDVSFISSDYHLSLLRCVYYNIVRCSFVQHNTAAITIDNLTNPDGGDGNITENLFVGTSGGYNIIWRSGGGPRISRNKILNGANGILVSADLPSSTSDFFVENNSIENQSGSGVFLARNSGVGGLSNISINGNQFAGMVSPISCAGAPASFLSAMQIVNNQIVMSAGGGTGINLANVTGLSVQDNQITSASGSPTGINIASTCDNGVVSSNVFRGTFADAMTVTSTTVRTVGDQSVTYIIPSANTLTLPLQYDNFYVTGTTNINAISLDGWNGRTVRLIFEGVLTVSDLPTVKLAGSFTTSAYATLTLTCAGPYWAEIARSVN